MSWTLEQKELSSPVLNKHQQVTHIFVYQQEGFFMKTFFRRKIFGYNEHQVFKYNQWMMCEYLKKSINPYFTF